MTKQDKDISLKEFAGLITSEPKRKGKPKLATPEETKLIWGSAK